MFTSSLLVQGTVYSREDLMTKFQIKDATINTGIFRPKGHDSVWLFVTKDKPKDRTQYEDRLDGDTLYWEGQRSGWKDKLIIEHDQHGLELLVFYRRDKLEFLHAAFRFEGAFRYIKHTETTPRAFVLERISPMTKTAQVAAAE